MVAVPASVIARDASGPSADDPSEVITAHGIKYRKISHPKYRYELVEEYVHAEPISIRPPVAIDHPFMTLTVDGQLTIRDRYAWDGASGPARDSANIMRASLVHDALYQMMRERLLGQEWRDPADQVLRAICLDDGMTRIRAWWIYWGVRLFGGYAARPAPTTGDRVMGGFVAAVRAPLNLGR